MHLRFSQSFTMFLSCKRLAHELDSFCMFRFLENLFSKQFKMSVNELFLNRWFRSRLFYVAFFFVVFVNS